MTIIALIFGIIIVKITLKIYRLKLIHAKFVERYYCFRKRLKELGQRERQIRKRLRELQEWEKLQHTVKGMENEPILLKFHCTEKWKPTDEDWKKLSQETDKRYDRFTYRLKTLAPSLEERDIRACLLLKIGVRRKNMAPLLFMTESGVSMLQVRMYRKITGKKTNSSMPLHNFIRDF